MTPPPSQPCQVEGCDWSTPQNIPSYELVLQSLKMHFDMVHGLGAAGDRQDNGGIAAGAGVKVEKPKRPQLKDEITEADWQWFEEIGRAHV